MLFPSSTVPTVSSVKVKFLSINTECNILNIEVTKITSNSKYALITELTWDPGMVLSSLDQFPKIIFFLFQS